MAKFQLIVSDPTSKTSKAASLEGTKAQALVGKSIGEEIDGKLLGLGNVKLRITGGTDKDGVPMRFDIQGAARKRAILSGGVGFREGSGGERQRRLLRGRTVSEETLQVNSVIVGGSVLPAATTAASAVSTRTEEAAKE
ncbi:MAG TPA: S6e family ribosomal protein [Candidatus Bathyarchaeia archaeon]|nr:S6e family ribosomal protein [Candidatus Bathyarchaeia archaeon]HEX4922058.1 S6e family ribosomal protein [Candidatus Bathyarchaeia archaeon]